MAQTPFNPFVDILVTYWIVLHGTARDWWEIARTEVKNWGKFETFFLSAFLSEDCEDELAECVRTCRKKKINPFEILLFCIELSARGGIPLSHQHQASTYFWQFSSEVKLKLWKNWYVLVISLKKIMYNNQNSPRKWQCEMFLPNTTVLSVLNPMKNKDPLSCVGDVRAIMSRTDILPTAEAAKTHSMNTKAQGSTWEWICEYREIEERFQPNSTPRSHSTHKKD